MAYKFTEQERLHLIGQIMTGILSNPQQAYADYATNALRASRMAAIVIDTEEKRLVIVEGGTP